MKVKTRKPTNVYNFYADFKPIHSSTNTESIISTTEIGMKLRLIPLK